MLLTKKEYKLGGGCWWTYDRLESRLHLESEQQQERHHKTEETHGFGKGETQNGVGEQLLFQRWIPGIADNEGTEHRSNTGTWSGYSYGGSASPNEFSRRVDIVAGSWGLESPEGWQ